MENKTKSPSFSVGSAFPSFEAAFGMVQEYSAQNGFTVRKSNCRKFQGHYVWGAIRCSRSGMVLCRNNFIRESRSQKIGCPFKVRFCLFNGLQQFISLQVNISWSDIVGYRITFIELSHNHELSDVVILFHPQHRGLTWQEKNQVRVMKSCSIPIPMIVKMIQDARGRYVHRQDIYNLLSVERKEMLDGMGEVAALLHHIDMNPDGVLVLMFMSKQ